MVHGEYTRAHHAAVERSWYLTIREPFDTPAVTQLSRIRTQWRTIYNPVTLYSLKVFSYLYRQIRRRSRSPCVCPNVA